VENIPFEVFSPFSATFAEVRKIQVNYFLEHWGEIRASEAMRNVWRQIRNGRHPGFEEGPWILLNCGLLRLRDIVQCGLLLPSTWSSIHTLGHWTMQNRQRPSCHRTYIFYTKIYLCMIFEP